MNIKTLETPPDRLRNIIRFYFIILGAILGFLAGEMLVSEFILHRNLTFFENMLPSSILYGLLFVGTLYYGNKTQTSISEMGFHSLYVPQSLLIGFLATSGYLITAVAFQMPLNYPAMSDILLIGCFAFLIGLTEETMFRGYIQTTYMKEITPMKAVLFTGILFALLHIPSYIISGNYLNILSVPSLILVGLILGLIRIHTGNIWGVSLVHTTWNYYLFLFAPVVTITADISVLIPALVASMAMWGTIVLAMLVAKKFIDRPEQIPTELKQEYSNKINALLKKIWDLQQKIEFSQRSGMPMTRTLAIYSNRVKIYEKYIEILKQYIPLIAKSNYKIIRQLVPLKLKLIKIEHLIELTNFPPRIALLEHKKGEISRQIQVLESALSESKIARAMGNSENPEKNYF